jgi:ribosomal protein L2
LNLNFIILTTRLVPKHSAYMNLILYENGLFSFIINSHNILKGKIIVSNFFRNLSLGAYIPLYKAPYGTSIYNVELKLGFGVKLLELPEPLLKY